MLILIVKCATPTDSVSKYSTTPCFRWVNRSVLSFEPTDVSTVSSSCSVLSSVPAPPPVRKNLSAAAGARGCTFGVAVSIGCNRVFPVTPGIQVNCEAT
jgi:hypothetical protein